MHIINGKLNVILMRFSGQFVHAAHADDDDTGANSKLVYHLSGQDADKFQIDQDTGVIKTAQRISGGESVYHLQVWLCLL